MKKYFKYVNQWSLLFWAFILLQVFFFVVRENDFWETLWSCGILWAFYLLGYNSLDRELEIKLEKAKEQIAAQK